MLIISLNHKLVSKDIARVDDHHFIILAIGLYYSCFFC